MSRTNSGPALTDDARFELAMGAAARERRNRPVALVIAAGLVLIIAAVVAATGIAGRASARARLKLVQQDQASVERMAADWAALDAQAGASSSLGQPMPKLMSTLEDLAVGRAGMKEKPKTPRTAPQPPRNGIVVTEYFYSDVRDPSLAALVEWVRLATEIAGLEVTSLDLTPDKQQWTMSVTFRRWERAG